MQRLILAVVILLVLVGVAWAAVDYVCVNKCLAQGYGWGYCKSLCTY